MSRILYSALLVALAGLLALGYANDKPKTSVDDLKLIPHDTSLFVSINVANVLATDTGKELLPIVRKAFEPLTEYEKALGVSLNDVERLTIVVNDKEPALILRTKKPFDAKKLKKQGRTDNIAGKTIHEIEGGAFVYLASDHVLALGQQKLDALVRSSLGDEKKHPLADAMKWADERQIVIGCQPEILIRQFGELRPQQGDNEKPRRRTFDEIIDGLPLGMGFVVLPYKPLLFARTATLSIDAAKELHLEAKARFEDKDAAEEAEAALRTARFVAREMLRLSTKEAGNDPEAKKAYQHFSELAESSLKSVKVSRDGISVSATAQTTIKPEMIAAISEQVGEGQKRQLATNHLKQIGIAIHSYHDMHGKLPLAAITDKNGKPLLSWRVTILPYIEQDNLYRLFKLDEPWDSANNKPLLKHMPKIYAPISGKTKEPHSTYWRMIVGDGTVFPKKIEPKYSLAQIPDGTSNTIAVVEAGEAVTWSKPDELEYDPKKALPKLGGQFPNGFLALMYDGSVRMVPKAAKEANLRAAITPDGAEVLPAEW